jgi:hypothetical protein
MYLDFPITFFVITITVSGDNYRHVLAFSAIECRSDFLQAPNELVPNSTT